jgi:hypothetical protein
MQFQVRYDESIDCVVGEFKGDMGMDSLKAYIAEIDSVVKKNTCKRFFNDLREARINFSIISIYHLHETIVTGEFDRKWRRAVLFNPGFDKEKKEFHETVSFNRGLTEKTFIEYDAAMEWLLS